MKDFLVGYVFNPKYKYIVLFCGALLILLIAFLLTFVGCAVIEYSNCVGELSFSHYEWVPVGFGDSVTLYSPSPIFICK